MWKMLAGAGALLVVVGCDKPTAPAPQIVTNQSAEEPIAPIVERPARPKASATPRAIASMIAAVERENGECRGGHGDEVETLRACNRRQALMKQLQDAGWCWGGADIEAEKRFIPCGPGDRDYSPGAFDDPYYSEEEIADLTRSDEGGNLQ